MKTVEDFIKSLVSIDYMEERKEYGHYPFQLAAETPSGGLEINALAVDDVRICYSRAKKYVTENANWLFMSVDFPAGGDIHSDFVAVFSVVGKTTSLIIIPYNCQTGERSENITDSQFLSVLKFQFESIVMPQFRAN